MRAPVAPEWNAVPGPVGGRAGAWGGLDRPRWEWEAAKKLVLVLAVLLTLIALVLVVPLRTAVQIGADEGFELAKATLVLAGHELYTEVWNDQPPLHTFLVAWVLKHISGSVAAPRLMTVTFSALLVLAVFCVAARVSGLRVAWLATAFLIASPGFLELSASCMLELSAGGPTARAPTRPGRRTSGTPVASGGRIQRPMGSSARLGAGDLEAGRPERTDRLDPAAKGPAARPGGA